LTGSRRAPALPSALIEIKMRRHRKHLFNQNDHDSLFGPPSRRTLFPMRRSYF